MHLLHSLLYDKCLYNQIKKRASYADKCKCRSKYRARGKNANENELFQTFVHLIAAQNIR